MSAYEGSERRRSGRLVVNRPVLMTPIEGEQRPVTAFTFSISQFGCAVRCATNLPPGTQITFECDGKKIPGKVTFVLKSSALEGFELCIEFPHDGSEFWGETF